MSIEFKIEGRFFTTDFEGEKQHFLRPHLALRKRILEQIRSGKIKTEKAQLDFGVELYAEIACDEKGALKYKKADDVWNCHIADQLCDEVMKRFLLFIGIGQKKEVEKRAVARKKRSSRTSKKGK